MNDEGIKTGENSDRNAALLPDDGRTYKAEAFLSLGSNLGDRMKYLCDALGFLAGHPAIAITGLSSVYETDPVDYADQDCFLNLVCRIETTLDPLALLHFMQETENRLGRVRTIRYGPRTIDLDLLAYGNTVLDTEELTLPHPRMHERAFVQIPLGEITEGAAFTGSGDPAVRLFGTVPENCRLMRRQKPL